MDGNLCVRLVLSLRAQFGQAAFLFLSLMGCAPLDWNAEVPAYVADERLISDASLAERLNVKPRRFSAWRKKLREAGKLDWTVKPGVGYVYTLAALVGSEPRAHRNLANPKSECRRWCIEGFGKPSRKTLLETLKARQFSAGL
jgi:hypothetical protein